MRSSDAASAALLACALSVGSFAVLAQVSQQRDGAVLTRAGSDASKWDAKRPALADVSKRIIDLTNTFRQNESLPRVEPDDQLAKPARYFADFMARTDQYGHSADGQTPAARARKFGYAYCIIAENIAYVYSSAGFTADDLAHRLFTGWRNSPGHRKNMLDPNVTETAVSIAHSAKTGHYYAVQLFGRPKSESIEFKVENRAGIEVEYVLDGQTFALPPRVTRTHQGCKPFELAFRGEATQPTNGQRLVVVNDQEGMQLKAQ